MIPDHQYRPDQGMTQSWYNQKRTSVSCCENIISEHIEDKVGYTIKVGTGVTDVVVLVRLWSTRSRARMRWWSHSWRKKRESGLQQKLRTRDTVRACQLLVAVPYWQDWDNNAVG